jgi:type IV pilus assembly protein PilB
MRRKAVTPAVRNLIVGPAAANDLRLVARDRGSRTLREAGLCKVLDGLTTVAEVLRVTAD